MPRIRHGKQTPRIDTSLTGNTERAELLFELLEEYGNTLLPWQQYVLKAWLAEDDDRNLINMDCGLSVPRQNGKSELLVARIIYGVIFRKSTILYTAQLQDTCDTIKKRVQDFFYDNEHEEIFNLLTPRFRKKPRNYDFIEFENGASVKFKTRTRLGGLGNTNDEVLNDEAAELSDAQQEALVPTTSACRSGNPQIIDVGTPPTAEGVSETFARKRRNKLNKSAPGSWIEWSVSKLTDPTDRNAWYQTNPSLGYFLLPKSVENEMGTLSKDGFNRMRLGWWSGVDEKRAISARDWNKCATKNPAKDPGFDDSYRPVYAVKFAPDRSDYSLAVAQQLNNGKVHVEIVMNKPLSDGYQPVAKWLLERWRKSAIIIVDGVVGQAILVDELTKSDKDIRIPPKRILLPNMREIGEAHQFMLDAINRNELSHFAQPLLDSVVAVAKTRPLGRNGSFGWASMSDSLSTSALDAATFALWGAKTHAKKSGPAGGKMSADRWRQVLSQL